MSYSKNADGTFRDGYGTPFQTNGGSAPTAGSPIKIPDGNGGYKDGTWNGSAQKN